MNNAAVVFDDKREENLKEKLAEERKKKSCIYSVLGETKSDMILEIIF